MATKYLSSVDTAWLRMEEPTNPMMITAVMIFDAPMDFERLKATLQYRLLKFDRFRQRVVQSRLPGVRPHFEDVPDFDWAYHLQRISLPPPGDQAALQALVSELMSIQLDFSRPLWQFHLVENYGDGCAIIARLHHCIADGIALIHILFSLTDGEPDAPWPAAEPKEKPGLTRRLVAPVQSAYRTTRRISDALWHESMESLIHPSHAVKLARYGTSGVTALGRLVMRWPDPKTIFKGPLGMSKRAAWSEPVPIPEVKEIARIVGGTVNDVLLTTVSGALRCYLQGRNQPVDGLSIRGVIPVNLRARGEEFKLGNKFGLIFLSLPLGVADPFDRLRTLKHNMDFIKSTPEALVAFGILGGIGMSVSQIQDIVVTIFGTKGTAVMTNVPGPRDKLWMAGAPLSTVMGWVPEAGHLGMGVSVISYNGFVRLGIATDEGLVSDPETIVANFRQEFQSLLALARKKAAVHTREFSSMLAELDDTLGKLEAMQEPAPIAWPAPIAPMDLLAAGSEITASPGLPAAEPPIGQATCQALTRSGKPCKNPALSGLPYCRVHQRQQVSA